MTITTEKTLTAREYLRVSKDKSKRAKSVDEQHVENTRAADGNGWTLGKPYEDNDRSASRYATRSRKGYERLVADLGADRFGADVLVLWEHSRGSRKVSEWVILLELLEQRGVKVHVTTHGRTYDPRNHRDRRSLLEDSVDSEYESSKTSDRLRRAAAAAAAEGRPSGKIPFGYTRRYDERTKELIAQDPDPETAPLVRELFDRVQGGHSLRSIERDWAARGIVNGKDSPFTAQHLRSLLLTRAYVGERVHNPGASSGNTAKRVGPDTVIVKGIWEPLVDRATFFAVQRILDAPERRTTRPGRGIHLLSMIARCDVCGGPLAARSGDRGPEYTCQRGSHVRVDKGELDTLVETAILGYLNGEDLRQALAATDNDNAEVARAREDVERIREELDDLAAQVGSGALSATLAARAEPAILTRLKAARDREKELSTPSTLHRLMPPGTQWETLPMAAKREMARVVLTPDMLGELRIVRRPRDAGPKRVPVDQRVEWRRE